MGVAVSVACGAMFLALLFPYLVQSRANARRETCQLRLTQIGLALAHYGEDFQSLPYGTQQNLELPPQKRLSWYPAIWSYIAVDAAPLTVHHNEPWDSPDNLKVRAFLGDAEPPENATDAPLFLCPAMQFERPLDMPGPTCYIGIAGAAPLPPSWQSRTPERESGATIAVRDWRCSRKEWPISCCWPKRGTRPGRGPLADHRPFAASIQTARS